MNDILYLMPKYDVKELEKVAYELRQDVITMLKEAGSGHTAGALGTAEIFSSLYFNILDITPKNFNQRERDTFILSGGHICPIWYATLANAGFFSKKELWKLRKTGALLQGHPNFEDRNIKPFGLENIPGVENASGSLGQGLSMAIGKAIAFKLDGLNHRVYCLTGDGELNEGQIWEAAMFAPHYGLNNLTWIIDSNGIQLDGYTKDILNMLDLKAKLESFGW
jgi:transketolase